MKYRIFIGYSHEDDDKAQYIHDCLARIEEFLPYKAERYQIAGEDFKKRLQWHLEQSFAMVVLLTEHGKNSQWVNQEIGYAYALKTRPQKQYANLPHIIPLSHKKVQLKGFITKDQQDILILDKFEDYKFVVAHIIHQIRWRIPNGEKEGVLHCLIQCPKCVDKKNFPYEWSEKLLAQNEIAKAMELNRYYWIHECPKCKAQITIDVRTFLPAQQSQA